MEKLEVPFYHQTTNLNCGPVALRMVISYLDKDPGLEILEQKTGIKEGKGVSTIQIATAAALMGYAVDFYSTHINFNQENLKLEFYQKYLYLKEQTEKLVEYASKAGVNLNEKSVALEEILERVSNHSIPIILLDWNIVRGQQEGKYHGHFVPITGYDDEKVYVHNHGLNNPMSYFAIPKDIFEKARKSQGTDEDIVFISRKITQQEI